MELIFESRSNLSEFRGTLHFVQWKPHIHPEPVLSPDTFVDGGGISSYGTVLKDEGKLKLWYQCYPEDYPGSGDIAAVAYAESSDGYHWEKRPLGIVPHGPNDNHLCDLGLHSPSVFIDPEAPPSHRYRATGCGRPGFLARPGLRYGYYAAHSADGLRWELDSPSPQWEGGDVINSIYHPGRRSGIVALKKEPWVNRLLRRCIHTATYRDGEYSDHVSAIYPDEFDDVAAVQRGHFSKDYNHMAMLPAGKSGVVGFICNLCHDLPYTPDIPLGNRGNSNITLAYQEREGDRWLHVPGRPTFIDHRDLSWSTEGWFDTTSTPVEVGDEHRLYFVARNHEHFQFLSLENETVGQPQPYWSDWLKRNIVSGMTFASWPKFRLFGFEAPFGATFDIDLGPITRPYEVRLNYRARQGGRVYASISGQRKPCRDLIGDEIAAKLVWENGSTVLEPCGCPQRLTINLEMAAVYAYEVVPVR
nr:hypothetical protein [uncultured bacterium]